MKALIFILCLIGCLARPSAQSIVPPLDEERLTIHTLVREDVFAGWRYEDMERFERAEKNIEILLEERPSQKAPLLAWKGGTTVYRAVLAYEADRKDEARQLQRKARELFLEARTLEPENNGVASLIGGSYLMFADRLPKDSQGDSWEMAYKAYQVLWTDQSAHYQQLPEHIRGELLAGMAQSAQRTGRPDEMNVFLDRILESLPDTRYERAAQKWKEDPDAAGKVRIGCHHCHADGRLANLTAQLDQTVPVPQP